MINQTLLGLYNLPRSYLNVAYTDTGLPKVKQQDIPKKIVQAPGKGTLTIQGTAAPIVNQLADQGRKVRGISFVERSASAFEQPPNPTAEVIVLYGVGDEVSLNSKVSGMVLRGILKYYADRETLLIIETDFGKAELLSRYDFRVTNFIKLPRKEETVWI